MRAIKFRAWSPQAKYMGVPFNAVDEWNNYDADGYWDTDAIFMQFTGLLDKNGKEIYEGDIVSLWYEERFFQDTVSGVVQWDDSSACFEIEFESISIIIASLDIYFSEIEVIGNLYENPELCKGVAE